MCLIEIMNILLFILCVVFSCCNAAKILAVFSAPSISHQIVFRPITQELVRRGHEVTIVTTDPAFLDGNSPKNLTEINAHNIYSVLKSNYPDLKVAAKVSIYNQFDGIFNVIHNISEAYFRLGIFDQIRGQKFDLLIVEAFHKTMLPLSHILQVPVMQMSSLNSMFDYETVGATIHPVLYPEITTQRVKNLSLFEMVYGTFMNVMTKIALSYHEENFDRSMKNLDLEMPSLENLRNKVSILIFNVQRIWEENRPVPIGVSYMGGVLQCPKLPMCEELKEYLDTSKNGVIYMSFGTNVHPSLLPEDRIQVLLDGLSKLPHEVLLKWDQDELLGKPDNVMIGKWFPQNTVLAHPNVKLFITQCGLQSTEEAINAGVPLLGIPFIFDQWTNAEKLVRHEIGLKLDIQTLTGDTFAEAVNTIIGDKRYQESIAKVRSLLQDQPHNALDTAIWWTEYAVRFSGASHLRSPAANMHWTQYFEVELLLILMSSIILVLFVIYFLLAFVYRRCKLITKWNVNRS